MTINAKLVLGGLIVVAVTAYMAYVGASTSWQYYVLVDECVASAENLTGRRVRVNGRVAADSLHIRDDRREATFVLEGTEGSLRVTCPAPLPDNLAEDIDVVVEGRLEEGGFLRGEKVITRCASKYESDDKST